MTTPVITCEFVVSKLTHYQMGSAVEVEMNSILPSADSSEKTFRNTPIGKMTLMIVDAEAQLQFQLHLGKPVKITFEIEHPLISVLDISPDALKSGLELRPAVHRITTQQLSPVETDTAPFTDQAKHT